jgi:cell division protein FtsN
MRTIAILLIGFITYACVSTEEVQKTGENTKPAKVYVFDNVTTQADTAGVKKDSSMIADTAIVAGQNLNKVLLNKNVKYFVQVGAFTTKARAERFAKLSEDKITFPLNITYNEKVKLFVVRLPFFRTRDEAEKVRDALWKTKEFKDAFIVTVME